MQEFMVRSQHSVLCSNFGKFQELPVEGLLAFFVWHNLAIAYSSTAQHSTAQHSTAQHSL
jgi:hypothetical protein